MRKSNINLIPFRYNLHQKLLKIIIKKIKNIFLNVKPGLQNKNRFIIKNVATATFRSPSAWGRSSSHTRERGMAVLLLRKMTTLTYRGKNYVQNKEAAKKQLIELTYRRNVYTNRMDDASSSNEKAKLNYRGANYTK